MVKMGHLAQNIFAVLSAETGKNIVYKEKKYLNAEEESIYAFKKNDNFKTILKRHTLLANSRKK